MKLQSKKTVFIFVFFLLFSMLTFAQNRIENLKQHVYTLSADSMLGRGASSRESRIAAQYIAKQFEEIGLKKYNNDSFYQLFGKWKNDGGYKNIIGIIEGNDSLLKDEFILIGAHYDHIGFKIKNNDTIVYNGADDNASGVATLIEVARSLSERKEELKRSVIFVAFDAEEIGLVGSTDIVKQKIFPLHKIKMMISADMVGWYGANKTVEYAGVGSFVDGEKIVKNPQLIPEGLTIKTENFEKNILVATDTKPFAEVKIPTLAVTTGLKSPYHKPEDDAHLIDYEGMDWIANHLENLLIEFSVMEKIEPTGKVANKHKSKKSVYEFGIISGVGSNYHYYTDGALDGKSSLAYTIGISNQINMGYFAIRPEILFENLTAQHPKGEIVTQHLTIPFNLVLQNKDALAGMEFFIGPYYSTIFKGKQGNTPIDLSIYNKELWGVNWGFSIRTGNIVMGFTKRTQITNFDKAPNTDNAFVRNRTSYFSVGWVF